MRLPLLAERHHLVIPESCMPQRLNTWTAQFTRTSRSMLWKSSIHPNGHQRPAQQFINSPTPAAATQLFSISVREGDLAQPENPLALLIASATADLPAAAIDADCS